MPVTQADADLIRAALAEFNQRGDDFGPADLKAFFERYYAPDAVIENVDNFPVPARYEGIEGYRRAVDEGYASYEDVHWEVLAIDTVGDHVVAKANISGRPRGEELRLEVAVSVTYEMRSGRIGHVRIYLGHDRALAAARAAV